MLYTKTSSNLRLSASSLPLNLNNHENLTKNQDSFKVVVIGGTGRVGYSTAIHLESLYNKKRNSTERINKQLEIILVGRNQDIGQKHAMHLHNGSFQCVDYTNRNEFMKVLTGIDLVIHTAGPFQNRDVPCEVLLASIEAGCKGYIDVCDDVKHMKAAKDCHELAKNQGIECVICTGIYPGVSNLMAVDVIESVKQMNLELDTNFCQGQLEFSYFTAGTGGAGATILESTMLLLGEPALVYESDKVEYKQAASQLKTVEFNGVDEQSGEPFEQDVYVLNLPEVYSLYEYYKKENVLSNVIARFATAPEYWNWLIRLTPKIIPRKILQNQKIAKQMSKVSLPFVRYIDSLCGSRTCIRVDYKVVQKSNPDNVIVHVTRIYQHQDLQSCVGIATAAFAYEMLKIEDSGSDSIGAGVWLPEEAFGRKSNRRNALLENAIIDADQWKLIVSKDPQHNSDVTRIADQSRD
eukprot:CAMPEP_0182445920 /NCGR_PEP_ID=MMETSP1172-20130603/3869_1 /TAXON_ID=708627 /ORGANISM="Timspurckia oligopyrenoides, Strain CCMP3278" /LENGTH=464 /DNA_ID=CAMNT_0024641757 /DNA_START=162 /DNA_END=1557 /DNA_ORIENTATION=+